MALAGAGDSEAFDVLAQRHLPRMHSVCRRVTGNEHDALDALQDALTAAWQRIGDFDGRAQIGTWLYRVAANAAVDEVRRRRRRPTTSEDLPATATPVAVWEDVVADRLTVDWAVAQLPAPFRTAIVLRDLCGLTYKEIAEMRQIPIDTVKSQIFRGRQALGDLLRLRGLAV
ncbi:DNA-directed RNA polymerase sigma-70 factor [Catellatospora citrea]|uniref:DNA-directed RNA polymerase sigma-70 factor n=1 Tax=Catellatospora citrea TaxID=53366 RepID=A0A8J3K4M5_9ACTN|nr:DNA-directed RNA polymerase sigma-70 factor [Catellatospora citrea]